MASQSDTMSPDPLALSLDALTDCKPKIKASPRPVTPTRLSGPSNGNVQLQDFYLTTPQAALLRTSSPTRSTAQTENLLSPWRIRVRVEAERNDAHMALKRSSPSPVRRIGQWTKTTTIPLKGADDSILPLGKRPRGRPRKSVDGPVKRKGTPKPRKSTRKKVLEENDNREEPIIEQATPSKRNEKLATLSKKRNTRTESILELDRDEALLDQEDSEPEPISDKRGRQRGSKIASSTTAAGKARVKRKIPSLAQNSDDAGTVLFSDVVEARPPSRAEESAPPEASSEIFEEPIDRRGTTLNRSLKRKRTTKEANLPLGQPFDSISPRPRKSVDILVSQEGPDNHLETQRKKLINAESHVGLSNEQGGFDSIIESEGFSMVSVSTLPSAKQKFKASPIEEVDDSMRILVGSHDIQDQSVTREPKMEKGSNKKSPRSSKIAPLKNLEPSSVKKSPNENVLTDDNPASEPLATETSYERRYSENYTSNSEDRSPSKPSPDLNPPRESVLSTTLPQNGGSRLGQTRRAASASQDIAQPLPADAADSPSAVSQDVTNEARTDWDLRPGGVFGSGTRRRLRDGLRIGAELELDPSKHMELNNQNSSYQMFSNHQLSGLNGFGPGSRRELKAGLRLGEELAKRQQTSAVESSKQAYDMGHEFPDFSVSKKPKLLTPSESDNASQSYKQGEIMYPELSASHQQHVNEIRYPNLPADQLLSSERSNDLVGLESESDVEATFADSDSEDRMSWKHETVQSNFRVAASSAPLVLPLPQPESDLDELASRKSETPEWRREREAEWQREREVISRQIREANASQVIVVDSSIIPDQSKGLGSEVDDAEAKGPLEQELEDEDFDIWQAEANASKNHEKQARYNTSADAPEVLFPEAQTKPRRSKLPSPWRRQSASNFIYSDEYPSTDPIPFLPSPEKQEPVTPLQQSRRPASRDDAAEFSNFSDLGRPVDECATVHFKRPRLVQSVEDKILTAKEEEIPDREGDLRLNQEDSREKMDLDRASQLHSSSPSVIRKLRYRTTVAGAKDCSTVPITLESKERPDKPGQLLLPRLRALHGSQPSLQDTIQPPAKASAQSSIRSLSVGNGQPPTRPSNGATPALFRAPPPEQSSQPRAQRQARPPIPSQETSSGRAVAQPQPTTHSRLFTSLKPFLSTFLPAHALFAKPSVVSEIAASSPPSPLPFTLHYPWTNAHYLVLQPLYLQARPRRYLSSYDPTTSASSFLLGKQVRSHGWSKAIEAWELGVVDAFMLILRDKGITLEAAKKPKASGWWGGFKEAIDAMAGSQGHRSWEELSTAEGIDEIEVVKRVFSLWVGRVQRGEESLGRGVAGVFDERYKARERVVKRLV